MNFPLVIKNGTLVTAQNTIHADIAIQGERIVAMGENLAGEREIDAANKLVTPGAVDIHVHMQMPLSSGVISSDTFFSGTRAAALGGTTTIIDFVAPEPKQSMLDAFVARRAEADSQVVIDYGLHMTIGPAEIDKLDQLSAAYEAGCSSFKLYMAYGFRLDDGQLLQALQAIRKVGGLPVVHAENWAVICTLIAQNLAQGNTSPHWHPRSRPALLEGEAAGRVIDIATYVGTPLHIFHVSCDAVIQKIKQARAQMLPITGETCPQYLFLTQAAYDAPEPAGALPVCAPPLRTQSDQNALWQAIAQGDLQLVATDHCPFNKADKARGLADFSQIPGGVPSIEMRFASIYSKGVGEGYLSLNQWVDLCCTKPAQLMGLSRKGDIAIGYDADLVIFDPDVKRVISTKLLHEAADWTPYEGLTIQGWPRTVISRGEVIVDDEEFVGTIGRGIYISRAI